MKELGHLDPIDHGILRALSLHEHLSTLQLWYELMGNENRNGWVTEESLPHSGTWKGNLEGPQGRGEGLLYPF